MTSLYAKTDLEPIIIIIVKNAKFGSDTKWYKTYWCIEFSEQSRNSCNILEMYVGIKRIDEFWKKSLIILISYKAIREGTPVGELF